MSEADLLILETARLVLRRQTQDDVDFLTELWSNPEVTRHMGGPREKDWLRTVFAETAADPFAEPYDLWVLVEKESGQPVGHCGLLDKDIEGHAEIELSYVLALEAQGKGYAAETAAGLKKYAFEELGLRRLVALIEPENAASERVALKAGLHFDRQIIRPGGALRKLYIIEAAEGEAGGMEKQNE